MNSATPPHTAPKVSVVVPVYNPGRHIEPCIESLLAQTLPPDQLELIFVDDGSTDDTPARLDTLAAKHRHITVIHQPNSGWSGRPRNVGTDAATGEYVQYVDQDDWLGTEALQRLYDYATANDSDVVIGKMVGIRRTVPRMLFKRSLPSVTIHDSKLMDSLTPHKMFRRQFLIDNRIRFPEGPRRLEDHVFVVTAYFAAQRISVYADYDCYFHIAREDQGNAGLVRIEPVGYFANLREALDVVDANTEPGEDRDRIYRRWLRVEILGRLRRSGPFRTDAPYRSTLFQQIHFIVTERFSPGVEAALAAPERHLTALIRAGDLDALLSALRREDRFRARAELTAARYSGAGLGLSLATDLVDPDGTSLRPGALADGRLRRRVFVLARADLGGTQRTLDPQEVRWTDDTLGAAIRVVLPAPGLGGSLPDGTWTILVRYQFASRTYEVPVTSGPDLVLPEPSNPDLPLATLAASRGSGGRLRVIVGVDQATRSAGGKAGLRRRWRRVLGKLG